MNHENYIGMDVRQATISVAVLGQSDDGMPAGDQGRPRFRLEASGLQTAKMRAFFTQPQHRAACLNRVICARGFPVGENFRLRCLPDLAAQNQTFARSTQCFPFFLFIRESGFAIGKRQMPCLPKPDCQPPMSALSRQ
jgi:hypothetical protein